MAVRGGQLGPINQRRGDPRIHRTAAIRVSIPCLGVAGEPLTGGSPRPPVLALKHLDLPRASLVYVAFGRRFMVLWLQGAICGQDRGKAPAAPSLHEAAGYLAPLLVGDLR